MFPPEFNTAAGMHRILVVDDEESIREITRGTLETFGYTVLTASDGTEAVGLYADRKNDIAVVVDEGVASGDLLTTVREAGGPELGEAALFDVYRGGQVAAGTKSVAISLSFRSPERTLTEDDAIAHRTRFLKALAERFGAALRA